MPSNSLDIRWSLLDEGTPHIEFWYPVDTPQQILRFYRGIQHNVPNRRIIKTVAEAISAGNEYSSRNVGYEQEMLRADIVLATKAEARAFTDFFKNVVKGSSGVFYFKNNFNGQESAVRLMENILNMGEAEGSPYSFSLLMKKEKPYTGGSLNMQWRIILAVVVPLLTFMGSMSDTAFILNPTNSLEMYAAGENSDGSMGIGDWNDRLTFTKVGTDIDWSAIAVGSTHSLALKDNGSLYSTGLNESGQLGLGDTTSRNTWTKIGTDSWISIGAGSQFSVGVKSNGTLWAWGINNNGQVIQGVKDSDPHPNPVQVGSGNTWTHVVAGQDFAFARKADGTLWAWGDNSSGKLGQSYSSDFESLIQIGTDTDWSGKMVGGAANGFAIKNDGTLYGWGWNRWGALGIGDSINNVVYQPQQVGVGSWKSIATGSSCTTGVMTAGTLWAWGDNATGELGQGTTDSNWHSIPVKIGSSSNWMLTSHGPHTAIAVNDSDEVYGWGHNASGELGLGHTNVVTLPTRTFLPPLNTVTFQWVIEPPATVGDEEEFIWDEAGGGGPAPGPGPGPGP